MRVKVEKGFFYQGRFWKADEALDLPMKTARAYEDRGLISIPKRIAKKPKNRVITSDLPNR